MASFVPQQAASDEQLLRKHLGDVYQEERGFGSRHSHAKLRPKSLAVAGMSSSSSLSTSMLFRFLQEPQVNQTHTGPLNLFDYCLVGLASESLLLFLLSCPT